jgi:hypothetical protein
MSIFGSLFSFNFENCSCLFGNKKDKQRQTDRDFYENKLMSLQDNTDIKVLPFLSFLPLTDIFPENNHVAGWSTYVIGKNKRLVVSQDNLQLSDNSMLNKRYDNVLEGKNGEFFDTVFQMIISGHENQFLMVYKEKLYFANTYTFRNEDKLPIGGILFIRLYTSMSELLPKNHSLLVSVRKSKEYERAMQELKKMNMEHAVEASDLYN